MLFLTFRLGGVGSNTVVYLITDKGYICIVNTRLSSYLKVKGCATCA